ncbi:MAG: hypothetical protein ABEL97_06060 [Salinibacter sp.]
MNAHLAVVGHRSSQPVLGAGGAPVDLADTALPASAADRSSSWLFDAIDDALRQMRVRQGQVPGDASSPLRLGLVVTAENGTALDVKTGSVNLRDLEVATPPDRQTVLSEIRDLEQAFLSGD